MALVKGLFRSTGDSGLSPINTQGRTILNWLSQILGSIPAAADLAAILARLDVNLSTRASDAALLAVLAQLDVALSTRGSEATLATLATEATLATQLDVLLSSRASEATVATLATEATLAAQLNITLSALRDALEGASDKNFTTLEAELNNKIDKATTPVMYNVAMALADTEYEQALPASTKKFQIKSRDGTSCRLAFETGKVAGSVDPFTTIPTSAIYWEDFIESDSITLYFACAVAGKKTEITAWS